LIVHDTASQVEKARNIIETTRPIHMTLHSAAAVGAAK